MCLLALYTCPLCGVHWSDVISSCHEGTFHDPSQCRANVAYTPDGRDFRGSYINWRSGIHCQACMEGLKQVILKGRRGGDDESIAAFDSYTVGFKYRQTATSQRLYLSTERALWIAHAAKNADPWLAGKLFNPATNVYFWQKGRNGWPAFKNTYKEGYDWLRPPFIASEDPEGTESFEDLDMKEHRLEIFIGGPLGEFLSTTY